MELLYNFLANAHPCDIIDTIIQPALDQCISDFEDSVHQAEKLNEEALVDKRMIERCTQAKVLLTQPQRNYVIDLQSFMVQAVNEHHAESKANREIPTLAKQSEIRIENVVDEGEVWTPKETAGAGGDE